MKALNRRRLDPFYLAALVALTLCAAACGDDGNTGSGDTGNNDTGNNDSNNGVDNNDTGNNDTNNDAPNNAPGPPQGGPNELVDHDDLLNPATLAIELDLEGSGTIQSGGTSVYLLNFSFTSQNYAGNTWRHQAALYIPPEPQDNTLLGVVQRGTENPAQGVSDNTGFTTNYGVVTATNMGLPVLILNDLPGRMDLNTPQLAGKIDAAEPRCKGGPITQADVITRCMIQVVHGSGDTSLDPFLHNAIAYSRAITAVQALPGVLASRVADIDPEDPPPALDIQKAALFGSNSRGTALPIAAAIDNRVVGVYQSSAAFGALPQYFALQRQVWPSDHPLGDPTSWESFLNSAAGQTYQEQLDPAMWPADLLEGKTILHAWGTQMTYAPLRAFSLYAGDLSADTHQFLIRDYADGLGSGQHLAMWQTFLAVARDGRPLPTVTANHTRDQGNIGVTATIAEAGTTIGDVTLFYVSRQRDNDDLDFRDAVWDSIPMEPKNNDFTASFSPLSRNTAYVVMIVDAHGDSPQTNALMASDVVVVEP